MRSICKFVIVFITLICSVEVHETSYAAVLKQTEANANVIELKSEKMTEMLMKESSSNNTNTDIHYHSGLFCHNCCLGHCPFPLGSFVFFDFKNRELNLISFKEKLFLFDYHSQFFRPPIYQS